jgi:hypothetical protein
LVRNFPAVLILENPVRYLVYIQEGLPEQSFNFLIDLTSSAITYNLSPARIVVAPSDIKNLLFLSTNAITGG